MKVAQIGVGYWDRIFSETWWPANVAASQPSSSCRQRDATTLSLPYPSIAVTDDAESVFRDPDVEAVVVATPVATHFDMAGAGR